MKTLRYISIIAILIMTSLGTAQTLALEEDPGPVIPEVSIPVSPDDESAAEPAEVLPEPVEDVPVATAEDAADSPASESEDDDGKTLVDVIKDGGKTMYVIALASLIALAAVFSAFFSLRRDTVMPPVFIENVRGLLSTDDVGAARDLCQANPSPIANILRAGLRKHGAPNMEVEKSIEDAGAREVGSMRQSIRVLAAVGEIAPLIGLFGTVLGIYESFGQISGGAGGPRPELLAIGINKALITTIFGLSVGIFAYTCYYFFRSRVDNLVYEVEEISIDLAEHLSGR